MKNISLRERYSKGESHKARKRVRKGAREREKHRERERETEREREREREREKTGGSERAKVRAREREKEKERRSASQRMRESARERERESERDYKIVMLSYMMTTVQCILFMNQVSKYTEDSSMFTKITFTRSGSIPT